MKMGKKRQPPTNPFQDMIGTYISYETHYRQYLELLALQLFEWKNLPPSVDPRYMEASLHYFGYVAFYKDPNLSYIATQGAVSGMVDHYYLPTKFQATSANYTSNFDLYNYKDTMEEGMGVLIGNNDLRHSTMPSLMMFARDLADLKEIISVNQNAQKTPILIGTDEDSKLSIKQAYQQMKGNSPAIFHHSGFNIQEKIQVFKTDAPYVVDKLNVQKNAVWNEIMTYLGIQNANQEKRERMITAEAESNNEQVGASGNVMLKSRLEAAEKINELYGLDIEVCLRESAVESFHNQLEKEGVVDASVNAVKTDN